MQKSMDYLLTTMYLCNIQYVGKLETSFNIATQKLSQPALILKKKDIILSNMQSLL